MLKILIAGCVTFWQRVRYGMYTFCEQRQISGIGYLIDHNIHYSERILWIIVLLASLFGTAYIVLTYLDYCKRNMFQFIMEDQPQNEILNFPIVAVSEAYTPIDESELNEVLKRLGIRNATVSYKKNLKTLLNVITYPELHKKHDQIFSTFLHESSVNGNLKVFDQLNYKQLAEKLRRNCSELLEECTWLRQKFNCCKYFQPLGSFSQFSFMLNSLQVSSEKILEMKFDKYTKNVQVELVLKGAAKVFLLNSYDIPEELSVGARTPIIYPGDDLTLDFQITPNYNDPELYDFSPETLQCYPPGYIIPQNLNTYKLASFGVCLTDCLRSFQMKKCGCIKHTLRKGVGKAKAKFCNITGYACLEQHNLYQMSSLKELPKSMCNYCLTACKKHGIDIDGINMDYTENDKGKIAKLTAKLSRYPFKRTRRQVIRNYFDISISLGGLISLCLGFSLIHLIELFYCIVCAFKQLPFLN